MTRPFLRAAVLAGAGAIMLGGCYRGPEVGGIPVAQNNPANIPDNQEAYARAASHRADSLRTALANESSEVTLAAMSSCTPDICAAVGRRELALGMSPAQVLVATNSSRAAWLVRGTESEGTMMPSTSSNARIADRVSEVVMVTFRGGRAISYTYREPAGLRTVAAPADATSAGRRRALAQSLLEQGDQLVAAGRSDAALARYDQADVIDPNDPGTTLRIAKLLDQQMRPVEALMRYQKFLHEMDIDRINAVGRANAELAGAVVAAQARVVHLQQTITRR